jgi:hypothetical protein
MRISVTSITSNVLLAIGLPPLAGREATLLHLDGQVHHDTHVIPMRNYVIAVRNYMIVSPSKPGNYVSVDTHPTPHSSTFRGTHEIRRYAPAVRRDLA